MARRFCSGDDFKPERIEKLMSSPERKADGRGRAVADFVLAFAPDDPEEQERFRFMFADALNEAATEVSDTIVKIIQEELPPIA